MNTIPVVPRCIGFEKIKNLPILSVDNWTSVDINFLNNAADEIKLSDYDMSPLSIEYWASVIDNEL